MSTDAGFSKSPRPKRSTLVKTVSFKDPISSIKYFNPQQPLNATNFELNFLSTCLLDNEKEKKNTLPYVQIKLGKESKSFNTVGLLDTGCSWSICEYKTFTRIPSYEKYILEKMTNVNVSCANDSNMKIEFKAEIPITFQDSDGNKYTFTK